MSLLSHWSLGKKLVCSFVSLMILGGAVYFFLPEQKARGREVTRLDQTIQTKASTQLIQTIFYEKCREEEKRELPVKKEEIGLNYREFQALYPSWNIELFNEEKVVMSHLDHGICLEHRKHKFVGIQGDYVAVFYGIPGKDAVLKELTQLKISSLQPQVMEELKRGIAFESNAEMLQILEGLHAR